MSIVTDPFERWAAGLLHRVAAGRDRFGVDEAKQLVEAVRALPDADRVKAWRLLDGFTETSRHEQAPLGLFADVLPISRPDAAAAELLAKESQLDVVTSGIQGFGEEMSAGVPASGERFSRPSLGTHGSTGQDETDTSFDFTDDPVIDLHGPRPHFVQVRRGADGDARVRPTSMGWTAVDPGAPGLPSPPVDPAPVDPVASSEIPVEAPSSGAITFRTVSSPDPLHRLVVADARGEHRVSDEVMAAMRAAHGPMTLEELHRALGSIGLGLPVLQQTLRQLLQAGLVSFDGGWVLKAVG